MFSYRFYEGLFYQVFDIFYRNTQVYFFRIVSISGIYWVYVIGTNSNRYRVDGITNLFDIYYKKLDRG